MKVIYVFKIDYQIQKSGWSGTAYIAATSLNEAQNMINNRFGNCIFNGVQNIAPIHAFSDESIKTIVDANTGKSEGTMTIKASEKPKKEEKNEEGFICAECGFEAKNEAGLLSHIRQKHS